LENGQPGKFTVATGLLIESKSAPAKAGGTNDVLEGKINGSFDYKINQALLPETLKGAAQLSLSRTEGAYRDLAGLSGTIDADMTPTDVRQLALRFQKQGQQLGSVR